MSRHITMNNSLKFMTIIMLLGVAGGAPALARASDDQAICSSSGVEGPYVFSVVPAFNSFQGPQGSISAFSPVALLGRYVFNGQGSVSRSLSVSLAGEPPFTVQDSGTYAVTPDCTGSVSFPDAGETLSFVVVSTRTIAIGTTTPGEVGAGSLQKQELKRCTLDSLRGNYVYTANGNFATFAAPSVPPNPPLLMDAFFPVSVVGLLTFDGRGGVKRNFQSVNFGGSSFPYADTGTYTVSGDCTGSIFFQSDQESFSLRLVNSRTVLSQIVMAPLPGVAVATIVKQDLDLDH
jgi:hypothetical protein